MPNGFTYTRFCALDLLLPVDDGAGWNGTNDAPPGGLTISPVSAGDGVIVCDASDTAGDTRRAVGFMNRGTGGDGPGLADTGSVDPAAYRTYTMKQMCT